MQNNDILRRLRYILNAKDAQFQAIFLLGGAEVSLDTMRGYLAKEEQPEFIACKDEDMARFLNGLIIEKRGKKEGHEPPVERQLNNNLVFKKLKIAFQLTSDDILDILELAGFELSSHELSGFFRKPGHRNFRSCQDQVLRNFLQGLLLKQQQPQTVWEKGNYGEPPSPA